MLINAIDSTISEKSKYVIFLRNDIQTAFYKIIQNAVTNFKILNSEHTRNYEIYQILAYILRISINILNRKIYHATTSEFCFLQQDCLNFHAVFLEIYESQDFSLLINYKN